MWLIAAISAYIILAIVQLVDKYLLSGSILSPKVYTFYVGIFGILALVFIPFVNFSIPAFPQIVLALLAGAVYIYALLWFFKALFLFEASRIIPTIGGLIPLFTFGLVYIFSFGKEILSLTGITAFIFLVLGSILINYEKEKSITLKSFQISVLAASLFSLSFVLTKYVYLGQPFWNGFIWTKIGGLLMAVIFFIFTKEIRKEIFKKKVSFKKKTLGIFISNQAAAGGANVLQNWAISLVPLAYVAVINALQGVQYAFLLVFATFISLKSPQLLKEEISKGILFQKISAILLIGAGLVMLSLK